MRVKTWTPNPTKLERQWWVVDANGQTLGRLATQVSRLLHGKHKPEFAPHADTGDFVIIINAKQVAVTGRRMTQKMYYRHSGYPGGLTTTSLKDMLDRHPNRVIELAVKGMLPKNRLGRHLFTKLKVYAGAEHPHEAQKPQVWNLE
jgi:large subunit ribosomal protein L13